MMTKNQRGILVIKYHFKNISTPLCCLAYCCCTFISWIAATTFVITLDLCQLLDSTASQLLYPLVRFHLSHNRKRFWYTRYQKGITFSTQGSGHRSLVKYRGRYLKFIYSEKATKFCEISANYLTGST